MLCVAIVGVVSAAWVRAMPGPRGGVIDDADRFAARVAAARDEAVITARPMGVWVSPSGYGFLRREAGPWIEMETKPFITTDWKQGTRAQVGQEGRQQLGFDSTGLPTDTLPVTVSHAGELGSEPVESAWWVGVWWCRQNTTL